MSRETNPAVHNDHRELPEKEQHLKEALEKLLGPRAGEYYRLCLERLACGVEGGGKYRVLVEDGNITGVILFFGSKQSNEGLMVRISSDGFVLEDWRGDQNMTEIIGHSSLVEVRNYSLPPKAIMVLATKSGSILYLGYDEITVKTGSKESVVRSPAVIKESLP